MHSQLELKRDINTLFQKRGGNSITLSYLDLKNFKETSDGNPDNSKTKSNNKIEQKERGNDLEIDSEDWKSDSRITDIPSQNGDDLCSLGSSDVQGNHFTIHTKDFRAALGLPKKLESL